MTDEVKPAPRRRHRLLSFRQALDCEQGRTKRCVCRCGGELHGAARFGEAPDYKTFMDLPRADPHRVRWMKHKQQSLLTFDQESADVAAV